MVMLSDLIFLAIVWTVGSFWLEASFFAGLGCRVSRSPRPGEIRAQWLAIQFARVFCWPLPITYRILAGVPGLVRWLGEPVIEEHEADP